VLDLTHDLKGAAALTDPKDTDAGTTPVGEELSVEDLDAVAGGFTLLELVVAVEVTGMYESKSLPRSSLGPS
jgi:hypothetical protein